MNDLPGTLLSTIQNLKVHDGLAPHVTHPFASSAEASCSVLQDIIQISDQLVNSLNQYHSADFTNTKLVSLLRQQAALYHSLHLSEQNVQQTVSALRKRSGTNYGEDIPPDRAALVDWSISRFEAWAALVGMETFKDKVGETGVSLVLGGKVLVVDVEFSVDRAESNAQVSNVKTSYAISAPDSSNISGSISLDAFLQKSFQGFLTEVQRPDQVRDPVEAARLGNIILDHLRYLVMLDRLAERKEDGGVRWFVDVDELCTVVESFSKSEAQVVASSLSVERAPLDIYLLRAHALPLPYLMSPCLSFLVYISPLSYLTLLRGIASTSLDSTTNPALPQFDVPLSNVRSYLASRPKGATTATLTLSPSVATHLFPASMSIPTLTTRPTFPLVPSGLDLEHVFPQLLDLSSLDPANDSPGRNVWMLDFTSGGKYPGVVMSQTKMRDIELVINPLSSMETLNAVGMMSYGTGSWVDLLLNPSNPVSPERYIALHRSPTSAHPPLQLRLTSPEEAGFLLEKVPVHSMKEVWGVLEVVREQCWLNETLSACQWKTEGLAVDVEYQQQENVTTEEDLQAVISGTVTPRKIPVNVFIPSHNSDPIFEASHIDPMTFKPRRSKIVMTAPEHPPISGLVEISVAYDETKARGISVEVHGALGADFKLEALEEICRRGGTLGLPGRLWAKAHES